MMRRGPIGWSAGALLAALLVAFSAAPAASAAETVFVVAPAPALRDGSAFELPALASVAGPSGTKTLVAMGAAAGGGESPNHRFLASRSFWRSWC